MEDIENVVEIIKVRDATPNVSVKGRVPQSYKRDIKGHTATDCLPPPIMAKERQENEMCLVLYSPSKLRKRSMK